MKKLLQDAVPAAVAVAGKLYVSVRDAENLPDTQSQGTGPVCVLKCGKNSQRTECHMDHCVNPVWHETFTYAMKIANIPKVLFRLRVVTSVPEEAVPFDVEGEDKLGEVQLRQCDILELEPGTHERVYSLGQDGCTLTLGLKWVNTEDEERANSLASSAAERATFLSSLDHRAALSLLMAMEHEHRLPTIVAMPNEDKAAFLTAMSAEDLAQHLHDMSAEECNLALVALQEVGAQAGALEKMSAQDRAVILEKSNAVNLQESTETHEQTTDQMPDEAAAANDSMPSPESSSAVREEEAVEQHQQVEDNRPRDQEPVHKNAEGLPAMDPAQRAFALSKMTLQERADVLHGLHPAERLKTLRAMSEVNREAALGALLPDDRSATMDAEATAISLSRMEPEHRAAAVTRMPAAARQSALMGMTPTDLRDTITAMLPEAKASALVHMAPRDKSNALQSLSPEDQSLALSAMCDADRKQAMSMLSEDDTAAMKNVEMRATELTQMAPAVRAAALVDLPLQEQASNLHMLTAEDRSAALAAMSSIHRVDMFGNMSQADRAGTLTVMPAKTRALYLSEMSGPERTEALHDLGPEERATTLANMSEREREVALSMMTEDDRSTTRNAEAAATHLGSLHPAYRAAAVASMKKEAMRKALIAMTPPIRAGTVSAMFPQERANALSTLPTEHQSMVLSEMDPSDRYVTITAMTEEDRTASLARMSAADRTDMREVELKTAELAAMPPAERAKTLKAMPPEERMHAMTAMPDRDRAALLAVQASQRGEENKALRDQLAAALKLNENLIEKNDVLEAEVTQKGEALEKCEAALEMATEAQSDLTCQVQLLQSDLNAHNVHRQMAKYMADEANRTRCFKPACQKLQQEIDDRQDALNTLREVLMREQETNEVLRAKIRAKKEEVRGSLEDSLLAGANEEEAWREYHQLQVLRANDQRLHNEAEAKLQLQVQRVNADKKELEERVQAIEARLMTLLEYTRDHPPKPPPPLSPPKSSPPGPSTPMGQAAFSRGHTAKTSSLAASLQAWPSSAQIRPLERSVIDML